MIKITGTVPLTLVAVVAICSSCYSTNSYKPTPLDTVRQDTALPRTITPVADNTAKPDTNEQRQRASSPAGLTTTTVSPKITTPQPKHQKKATPITKSPAKKSNIPSIKPLDIKSVVQTGTLELPELREVSGLVASQKTPGVLFAINDSGNSATLYALSETGKSLGQWPIAAKNRDWEDMSAVKWQGKHYLIIGDTGDNRRRRKFSRLLFIEEPNLDQPNNSPLIPSYSIQYVYEDGPRNVEAISVSDQIIYFITKEPVTDKGPQPSRVYTLKLQPELKGVVKAKYLTELPALRRSLESRLAASIAHIDLNHPTALSFDASGTQAYVLTYRNVFRYDRQKEQSWAQAFSLEPTRIHKHNLEQAEALTIVNQHAVFLTTENHPAPLWAIPIEAPKQTPHW